MQRSHRRGIGTTIAVIIIIAAIFAAAIPIMLLTANLRVGHGPLITTVTSATCIISAEGTGFYVTALSDAAQPIQGAQVAGIRVTEVNGNTCNRTLGTLLTNSTGSVLITPSIGSYYHLTIQYQGRTFSTQVPIEPMQTTYVTLKVPSGNFSITEIPFGGCKITANSITCPG